MARLTPFAKILIGFVVVAGGAAVGYNIIKNSKSSSDSAFVAQTSPAKDGKTAAYVPTVGKGNAPDIRLGINSFHGFAGGLVANGNSLRTKPGSIFDKAGLDLEFVIQDDIPTLDTVFTSGSAQCTWRTSDFWAQEQPNLRNAGMDARAIMVVDNTQGADAIVARDSSIRRIEDLAGKKVALLQYTPGHGLLIDALESSSLSARALSSVQMVFINADEGMAGVAAALTSGAVDAAVMWDPDLSMVTKRDARVIYSTKTASNLIFDMIVCDKRFLDSPAGRAAAEKLVAGWMEGAKAARANPDNAANALVSTLPYYEMLAKEQGMPFLRGLFGNLVLTGLEDNARIFGLVGGTNHYERVYRRFDGIYRGIGALANPKSPVIPPQDSVDYSFIRGLLDKNKAAESAAKEAERAQAASFTVQAQKEVVATSEASVTKPVSVNFETGSSTLTRRAQQVIDTQMVPFIENNGSAYFEVSGNTDSTGSIGANMALSNARAAAVVDYLVKQWEFPAARFRVVGNGPNKPICNEDNPSADGLSLEECRASNRTTRVAVYSAR